MPKITIPATITLDLPAAAEWADIFDAVDKVKQQPEMTTTIIAPASAKKLTPMPAAVIERLRQAGNRFVSMRNLKKHLRKQFHKRDVSRMVQCTSWSTCCAPKGSRSKPTRSMAAATVL